MKWTIEYFEQQDTTQPAEVFEDKLVVTNLWKEYMRTRRLSPVQEEENE